MEKSDIPPMIIVLNSTNSTNVFDPKNVVIPINSKLVITAEVLSGKAPYSEFIWFRENPSDQIKIETSEDTTSASIVPFGIGTFKLFIEIKDSLDEVALNYVIINVIEEQTNDIEQIIIQANKQPIIDVIEEQVFDSNQQPIISYHNQSNGYSNITTIEQINDMSNEMCSGIIDMSENIIDGIIYYLPKDINGTIKELIVDIRNYFKF
jgi:hypothetical protein